MRELYLGLGRVDVHVHGRTAELHIQHARGKAAHEQRVAVGLFERGLQCGGADPPAVAEEVLLRAAAAPGGGRGDEAVHARAVGLALAGQQAHGEVAPEQTVDAAVELVVAGGEEDLLPVADAAHGHVRPAERAPQRGGGAGRAFRAVGLQEFAPRGRVEKQVAHDHRRALGAAGLVHVLNVARVERHVRAGCRAALPRRERDVRHGADRGQRLAAKAHRADGLEPLLVVQLARRVAQKRDACVLGRHAAAVVRHAQIRRAAAAQLHRHGAGPGVKCVFHQLLDHRGGPLHDLARGDQIRQMRRENLNIGHRLPSFKYSPWGACAPRVYYKGLSLKIPPRNATIFYHTSNFIRPGRTGRSIA